MFCLSRPSRNEIDAFLLAQQNETFSYAEVGYSRQQTPRGYVADRNRIALGKGAEAFERAKSAVRNWKMFDMPWVQLCWPNTPLEPGVTVAVLISHVGFWSLNACRVVYLVDEHGTSETYGFAYGTLQGHGERGEERFTVEFNSDQSVWYGLYAFSRPNMLARLAYPYTRSLQKRFAKDSKAAMQKAVQPNVASKFGSNA